ncbi:hypothetical protein DFH09DRAFT_471167 [Mycena vulgaris]|nr:hypothetical protein DFH09DRAFT_471167 [Mycena vulgaris]
MAAAGARVSLGAVVHAQGVRFDGAFEVAYLSHVESRQKGWTSEDESTRGAWTSIADKNGSKTLENGLIRVDAACVVNTYYFEVYTRQGEEWLAQAWSIFNDLNIRSNLQDCVLVDRIRCHVEVLGPFEGVPRGYLFLSPVVEMDSCVIGPDCPTYWALDGMGVERLTSEEARGHGFPEIRWTVYARGTYWSDEVYKGIRQIHAAKGYDSDGRDVAIDLGYPPIRLACELGNFRRYLGEVQPEDDHQESPDEIHHNYECTESYVQSDEGSGSAGESIVEETESLRPSQRWIILIYVHLGLIFLSFGLSLCGFSQ